jgi:putative DNA methylase
LTKRYFEMSKTLEARTYLRSECVVFRKTKELFGDLSNMAAGYYLKINGTRILTSEALYQACRFPHRPEIQRLIVQQASPMTAKMKTKPYRNDSRPDWDAVRIKIMRWCLRVKLVQNWAEFGRILRATQDRAIVEDSRKDDFWGAKAVDDETLVGVNVLGRLLMELREDLKGPNSESLRKVLPLNIPDFRLFGEPIGIVEEKGSSTALVVSSAPSDLFSQAETGLAVTPRLDSVSSPGIDKNDSLDKPVPTQPVEQPVSLEKEASVPMKLRKKLIEVALPLEAINKASAKEKSIRQGHPSTLHLWWARRPLAAARAVIFSQMVDDPSEYTDTLLSDPNKKRAATRELGKRKSVWEGRKALYKEACGQGDHSFPDPGPEPTLQDCIADIERERLFRIIEDLVLWENTTNGTVLQQARDEIWQSWRRACAWNADHPRAKELFDRYELPAFHDPFAGGGTLPLEAQRLGLEAYASDLNPVAVLINKAMIEIPPKFAGRPPVNPEARGDKELFKKTWKGAQGLAEDVRYYGQWMREEAEKRIGHLYPKVEITEEMAKARPDLKTLVGQKLTVIAWLWARTVKSPNPAFANVDVPLASTFMLSTKTGKEAYVEPVIENGGYRFTVKVGKPRDAVEAKKGTKISQGSFRCLISNVPIRYEYIDDEANAGRMGERLMAIVAEGPRGRIYLPPIDEMEAMARTAKPTWKPDAPSRGTWASNAQGRRYGFETFGDYFSPRQLVALTTFSDLLEDACKQVRNHALAAGLLDDDKPFATGGTGATAYADAVVIYLAIVVDKAADYNSTICRWIQGGETLRNTFGRQAIPMTWDYCETNSLGSATGSIDSGIAQVAKALEVIVPGSVGTASQSDAQSVEICHRIVSTDPPYYDNIGYADLSDFFYVWLRRALKPIFPSLFATLAVPKAEELVATPYRHGSKEKAEAFFLDGMTRAMCRLAEQAHPGFPVTIYYAFKQSESDDDDGTASTGWDTFLEAVIHAGFAITGTWPMRTERGARSSDTNTLASSIILVCRKRTIASPTAARREFITALKSELPGALTHLQRGNIAPVDLAQAAIGPGMAIYTRYSKVLDAEGNPLSVREALTLINQTLDEALAEQEGDFDADSRWAVAWFEQAGFTDGEYGVAETLSKAKNTSIQAMVHDGILTAKGGKVRLLRPEELQTDWDPVKDQRITAWEIVHHLIHALESEGEGAMAVLVAKLGAKADVARELAYRLYTLCERKKRAVEALSYNALVQSWPEVTRLARESGKPMKAQVEIFDEEERE